MTAKHTIDNKDEFGEVRRLDLEKRYYNHQQ